MTMTISSATARLGREMGVAHVKVDEALVATAALLHSAAIARVDITEVDPALGHAALLRVHKSLGDLIGVRADLIRAHGALKSDLRTVAGPEHPDCPDYILTRATSKPKQRVA